jgi:hypothetical protein
VFELDGVAMVVRLDSKRIVTWKAIGYRFSRPLPSPGLDTKPYPS